MNRHFSIEDIYMAHKHMNSCSTALSNSKIQIKTTIRYHLTPFRMTKVKNKRNSRCWQGYGRKRTLLHWRWECKLVQPLWKTVWRFLKKLKIELPYDPAIALLSIYSKDTDVVKRQDTSTPIFIPAMSTIAKLWKEPWSPLTDEWIKKMWYIHTMEY